MAKKKKKQQPRSESQQRAEGTSGAQQRAEATGGAQSGGPPDALQQPGAWPRLGAQQQQQPQQPKPQQQQPKQQQQQQPKQQQPKPQQQQQPKPQQPKPQQQQPKPQQQQPKPQQQQPKPQQQQPKPQQQQPKPQQQQLQQPKPQEQPEISSQPTKQVEPEPRKDSEPTEQGPKAGDLVTRISKMSLGHRGTVDKPPRAATIEERKRKSGKQGRTIKVRANHYEMKLNCGRIYHYDVEWKFPFKRELRRTDKPMLVRAVEKLKREHCASTFGVPEFCIVYDGQKSLYSAKKLKFKDPFVTDVKIVESLEENREIELKVKISLVEEVEADDKVLEYCMGRSSIDDIYKTTQVLNIVLGMTPQLKQVTLGRNIFNLQQKGCVIDLEDSAKALWKGTFLSVRFGWKPFVNVDMANVPAYNKSSVMELAIRSCTLRGRRSTVEEIFRDKRMSAQVSDELKGLKVRFNRPDGQIRKYRVLKLVDNVQHTKIEKDNKKVTLVDYYKLEYGYRLEKPNLPWLHVGNPTRFIYLPMELCEVEQQAAPKSKKLRDTETASIIKKTAVKPDDRKKDIQMNLQTLTGFYGGDNYAKAFGVSMSREMALLNARVLPPPNLAYDGNKVAKPIGGKWTCPGKFVNAKKLMRWGVLDLAGLRPQQRTDFVDVLYEEANKVGLQIEYPEYEAGNGRDLREAEKKFNALTKVIEQKHDGQKPELIMVFVEARGPIYGAIKYLGDIQHKFPTQVLLRKNVLPSFKDNRISLQTVHNICLKLNSKLGGTNQKLHEKPALLMKPIMLVGADVTHASPDQRDKPSIASVVGSCDPNSAEYNVEVRVQYSQQTEEVILDMEDIMKSLLLKFFNRTNGRKPEKIVMYRDGVSEGQFLEVLAREMSAIRRACMSLEEGYKPGITFLVAQKRHKTRLFPENPKDGVGRMGNIPPGTVVDTDIVHPVEYDFFLASHEGIQGTTKPTHYHLLWDDNDLNMDEIQRLTYYLCHLYTRCERSVSYPAPTYYAHLTAFRARFHHNRLLDLGKGNDRNLVKEIEKMTLTNYFI